MDETILKQKQLDDMQDKKKHKFKKIVLITIVILFFSMIAILSMILENPKNKWIIINSDSNGLASNALPNEVGANNSLPDITGAGSSSKVVNIDGTYPVYIVGEVNNPGIYNIEKELFLYQLVDLAGGLTDKAAKNSINLAFKITKNQMIKIPSYEEIKNGQTGGVAQELLLDKETGFDDDQEQNQTTSKININTANETELDKLPGIGIATAKLIIDYRGKNGDFKSIEDIMKIPGIKESKFTLIKDQITV